MKCIIEGCENETEFIFKHSMSSNLYCKKHFDVIYRNENGEEE